MISNDMSSDDILGPYFPAVKVKYALQTWKNIREFTFNKAVPVLLAPPFLGKFVCGKRGLLT